MPKLLRVTIEFPLHVLSKPGFPIVLLRDARFLRLLRQDPYGFQVTYRVPAAESQGFRESLRARYEAVLRAETLRRNDEEGLATLFIRGRWLRTVDRKQRDQAAKMLRSLSDCQRYLVRSPKVVGTTLRVSIGAERPKVERILARFDERNVPHRIVSSAEAQG